MKIKNYSIYMDEPYVPNFSKLYKGVIVVVTGVENGRFFHFGIKTKKNKDHIFKTSSEEMYKIIFNDFDNSISVDFERNPKNKSTEKIVFDSDTYGELKENIPIFLNECGCKFDINNTDNKIVSLIF